VKIDELRRAFPDRRIDYYPVIDSTMLAAAALPLGSVVIAGEQTAGQGRHGHTWHSPPDSGIYCSIVLQPAPALTLAIGLATVEAIAESTGIACDLRWPNDLMLDGKKCAGILVQLNEGKAIAGIGVNVNRTEFPTELAAEATSLRIHSPTPNPRPLTPILLSLVPAIGRYAALPLDQILDLFTQASSYVYGRRVVVNELRGVTAGLDPSGFLKLRQDDGTVTLILAGGVRAVG
jgi:BirA family transcriptional regulator, biotin operon repressor / biotin---[acetyl-CoA-carboxylase] ligase